MIQGTKPVKKDKYLSKEEQLELGTTIQASLKAQEEIKTCDPDSPEYAVLQAAIDAGPIAVDELIRPNVGLVYEIAKTFKSKYPNSQDFEDMIQDGMAGLVTAAYKYDPTRGNRFTTMAYKWIYQCISRGCNNTSRSIRIPENRIYQLTKINAIKADPANAHLSAQEIEEKIMQELNINKRALMNIYAANAAPDSLNRIIRADSGGHQELSDFVPNLQTATSSESEVVKASMTEILHAAIDALSPVQRDVVNASFGFGDEEFTPAHVRSLHNIKEAKYRSVHRGAIEELRKSLENEGMSLSDFLSE